MSRGIRRQPEDRHLMVFSHSQGVPLVREQHEETGCGRYSSVGIQLQDHMGYHEDPLQVPVRSRTGYFSNPL